MKENPTPIYDINVYQGANWGITLTLKDENKNIIQLADYTAMSQWRDIVSGEVIHEFTVAAGNLVINPSYGLIVMNVTPEQSAAFKFRHIVHDVLLKNTVTGNVRALISGQVYLHESVTKWPS